MPSKLIPVQTLFKMLSNPYYKGVVVYKGVEYPRAHEPLISDETFEQIQTVLASKVNGENTQKHHHFLKGTLYCADCGSRIIITNVKKKNGNIYFCGCGRHRKRFPSCQTRHALIPEVERQVERIYDNINIPHDVRVVIEEELQKEILREKKKYDTEMNGLLGRKRKLEHKSEKLLEAHYDDAIPLELLKKEQRQIGKELAAINNEIKQHDMSLEEISQTLTDALALLDDCASFYRNGNDNMKRLLNQAIFKKISISYPRGDAGLSIEPTYNQPFDILINAKDRILEIIKYGLSSSCTTSNFFSSESCNMSFMVEAMGIEPMSESIFTGVSPSAAFVLKFRLKHRPKAGYIISYPVSPLCCRAFT